MAPTILWPSTMAQMLLGGLLGGLCRNSSASGFLFALHKFIREGSPLDQGWDPLKTDFDLVEHPFGSIDGFYLCFPRLSSPPTKTCLLCASKRGTRVNVCSNKAFIDFTSDFVSFLFFLHPLASIIISLHEIIPRSKGNLIYLLKNIMMYWIDVNWPESLTSLLCAHYGFLWLIYFSCKSVLSVGGKILENFCR